MIFFSNKEKENNYKKKKLQNDKPIFNTIKK